MSAFIREKHKAVSAKSNQISLLILSQCIENYFLNSHEFKQREDAEESSMTSEGNSKSEAAKIERHITQLSNSSGEAEKLCNAEVKSLSVDNEVDMNAAGSNVEAVTSRVTTSVDVELCVSNVNENNSNQVNDSATTDDCEATCIINECKPQHDGIHNWEPGKNISGGDRMKAATPSVTQNKTTIDNELKMDEKISNGDGGGGYRDYGKPPGGWDRSGYGGRTDGSSGRYADREPGNERRRRSRSGSSRASAMSGLQRSDDGATRSTTKEHRGNR